MTPIRLCDLDLPPAVAPGSADLPATVKADTDRRPRIFWVIAMVELLLIVAAATTHG
jgi:hypothetical protein